jgi:hypothetical protein
MEEGGEGEDRGGSGHSYYGGGVGWEVVGDLIQTQSASLLRNVRRINEGWWLLNR